MKGTHIALDYHIGFEERTKKKKNEEKQFEKQRLFNWHFFFVGQINRDILEKKKNFIFLKSNENEKKRKTHLIVFSICVHTYILFY